MAGQNVCRAHGGAAHKAKGLRVLQTARARQRAAELIVAWGEPVEGDPIKSLLRMVSTAAAAERAFAHLLRHETDGALLVDVETGSGIRQEPHPYLKLWNDERDRLARMAKMSLDTHVTERGTAKADDIVNAIEKLLNTVLYDPGIGLPREQTDAIKKRMALEVRMQHPNPNRIPTVDEILALQARVVARLPAERE